MGRGCTRGDTRGREWAMVVASLQTQKKRDEKEGRGGEGEWSTKTRHCVAQLAGRDEGEKYPEGEIHGRTQREEVNEIEREREREGGEGEGER